jgi:ADP-ribose pyrophosphatase YjhB (NUDIX family)
MKPGKIRPIAICIIWRDQTILVFEGYDSVDGESFYRPLGGALEFGEHSSQAIRRELREEIGAELANLRFLGVLENVFTHEGQTGHEIVMVYEGEFADKRLYEKQVVMGHEDSGGQFKALWMPLADFTSGKRLLVPEGLLKLLLVR